MLNSSSVVASLFALEFSNLQGLLRLLKILAVVNLFFAGSFIRHEAVVAQVVRYET